MSEKITLSGVPETMLQTTYARAKESRTRGAIHDEKAVQLIERLDYDFTLADTDAAMHSGVIASNFKQAEVFVETMNPAMAKHFKEKSIEGSKAKFTWGIRSGKALAELLPGFQFVEARGLIEGMAAFVPVYKLLDKLPLVRSISNQIIVLKTTSGK